jgi:hypothetical protein
MSEQKAKPSGKLVIAGAALVVIVVIVVIAVALSGTRRGPVTQAERYLAGDLQGLASAEMVSKMTTGKYSADLEKLAKLPTVGVSNPDIKVSDDGWSATVTSKMVPDVRCAMAVGMRNPLSWFAKSGEIVCKQD